VGDRLYVSARQGGDEVTLCLNAQTGDEIWRDKHAVQEISGPAARVHVGPRGSPAVADGKVVTIGVTGVLSCLNAADGKLVWRKDEFSGANPRFFHSASPIVVDSMAIALLGGPNNGGVVAYDLNSGDQKWKWAGDAPGYGSPVVMTADGVKQIVTLTDKMVVGLASADGKELWQIPFAVSGRGYNAATPIVDGSTMIITGANRGTKAFAIKKEGDSFKPQELWSNQQLATQFNTPVLKDGFLYGLSNNGNLFCINAKTGETAWTDSANRQQYAAMLDVGPAILALTQRSQLSVIEPSNSAFKELASYKVADKETFAHPVVAGNRIYVRDADSLTLWTLQ
jgi:outer membrane protein assembly factor BamB